MTRVSKDRHGSNSEATVTDAGCRSAVTAQPAETSRFGTLARNRNRWGVILAGGDGVRLQPLTRFICGDDRPKQFCPLFDGRTLLEQTLQRCELNVPRERLLVSLTSHHRQWYSQQAGLCPAQRIVQPANKGTAPAILHSLLSVARLDVHALVAILPCDHHVADEARFASALECAFGAAAERADSVVLLGARPDCAEVEYGWIQLGEPVGDEGSELFRVRGFQEKAVIDVAQQLFEQGSVWNTFVMVGTVQAFLQIVQTALTDLLAAIGSARLWAGKEVRIEESLYKHVPSINFSRSVLSTETDNLTVLRLAAVGWSDLGDPGRAVKAVRDRGCKATWIQKWGLTHSVPSKRQLYSQGSNVYGPDSVS